MICTYISSFVSQSRHKEPAAVPLSQKAIYLSVMSYYMPPPLHLFFCIYCGTVLFYSLALSLQSIISSLLPMGHYIRSRSWRCLGSTRDLADSVSMGMSCEELHLTNSLGCYFSHYSFIIMAESPKYYLLLQQFLEEKRAGTIGADTGLDFQNSPSQRKQIYRARVKQFYFQSARTKTFSDLEKLHICMCIQKNVCTHSYVYTYVFFSKSACYAKWFSSLFPIPHFKQTS